MRAKDVLGRDGERLAAVHVEELGWRVLARNWRGPSGEIDLVARDGDELVIVEVKTRRSMAFGDPLAAVGPAKLARLHRLALEWRAAAEVRARFRVDVVGILLRSDGTVQLEHLRGVR